MRCNTCGDYIARGKKFNARKETVENEEYLGLKVFRFYFKCPRCMQEITFKTDPKSYDYVVEHGATPNFKALKLAEQQAIEEKREKDEEELLNPMKLLENRTKASRREMENLEALEDLKEMNQREVVIDYDEIIKKKKEELEAELKKQEEKDELFVQSIFAKNNNSDETEEEIVEEVDLYINNEKSFDKVDNSKCTDVLNDKSEAKVTSKRKLLQDMVVVKRKATSTPDTSNVDNQTKTSTSHITSGPLSLLCNYSDSDSE